MCKLVGHLHGKLDKHKVKVEEDVIDIEDFEELTRVVRWIRQGPYMSSKAIGTLCYHSSAKSKVTRVNWCRLTNNHAYTRSPGANLAVRRQETL